MFLIFRGRCEHSQRLIRSYCKMKVYTYIHTYVIHRIICRDLMSVQLAGQSPSETRCCCWRAASTAQWPEIRELPRSTLRKTTNRGVAVSGKSRNLWSISKLVTVSFNPRVPWLWTVLRNMNWTVARNVMSVISVIRWLKSLLGQRTVCSSMYMRPKLNPISHCRSWYGFMAEVLQMATETVISR